MGSAKEFSDACLKSKENFLNLDEKIQSVILECKRSKKISSIYELRSGTGVKNASTIEVYKLNDLYVYRYLNEVGEPINYRISENVLVDNFGNLKTTVPCIEYSKGGVGNGAPLYDYGSESYLSEKSISFLYSGEGVFRINSKGRRMEHSTYISSNLLYSLFEKRLRCNGLYKLEYNGDLLNAIEKLDFDNQLGIKSLFDKIESRTLSKKKNKDSRNNFLKILLLKLFKTNVEIDVWSSGKSKGNVR